MILEGRIQELKMQLNLRHGASLSAPGSTMG